VPDGDHVALVYAVGDVVDGDGGPLRAREQIASRPLTAALRALAADDDVKAVVLRIDSPGGSALASEQIWHAVDALKQKKPVIVSMAGVAASGGYYIACGATKIYADRTTLTGSIGVVGGKLAIADALAGIGVRTFPRGRGKRALLFASLGAWSDDERAAVQQLMQGTYDTFVGRVASGRSRPRTAIEPLAQGRVWTGEAAVRSGLIDEIGGLTEALAEARKLGSVDADEALEVYPPTPSLLDLVHSIGDVSLPAGLDTALAGAAGVDARTAAAVRAQVMRALRFRDAPVQTVAFLPSLFR
jgi:protease-4